MEKPTIFFDMDGVLVRSNDDHYRASSEAVAEHGYALPPNARELNGIGWNLRMILESIKVPDAVISDIRKRRDELYIELLRHNAQWMPGALETLRALRMQRRHVAVITNSVEPYLRVIHEKLGIRHLVNLIVTPDRYNIRPKPAPDGIVLAREILQIEGKIAFVGDNHFDVEAAHLAEAFSCHFDPEGKVDPTKITANKIIKSLQEVLALAI